MSDLQRHRSVIVEVIHQPTGEVVDLEVDSSTVLRDALKRLSVAKRWGEDYITCHDANQHEVNIDRTFAEQGIADGYVLRLGVTRNAGWMM